MKVYVLQYSDQDTEYMVEIFASHEAAFLFCEKHGYQLGMDYGYSLEEKKKVINDT